MSISKNIAGMLRAPVGNNLDNNLKDVENTKKHYAAIGRYKRPVENGYIDQELDDAIYGFQRDNDLKVDGRMNPGGETEATLIGEVMKIPKPKKQQQEEKGYQTAAAGAVVRAVPPLLAVLGAVMGKTGKETQEWWENGDTTPEEREEAVKSLPTTPNNDDENRKQDCEDEYEEYINACKKSGKNYGWDVERICRETAFNRYSQCLTNKPQNSRDRVKVQDRPYD